MSQQVASQAPPIWQPGRIWEGRTVVILASGFTLSDEQLKYVRGKALTIAINTTYQAAPWATMLYGCDYKWWNWHEGAYSFEGLRVTSDMRAANEYDAFYIPGDHRPKFSVNPCLLHYGRNSGYQAINLAILLGANRIILLGYDMHVSPKGSSHWHGDHPDKIRSTYKPWLELFAETVPQLEELGVKVINCTPGSALDCYDKSNIRTALP